MTPKQEAWMATTLPAESRTVRERSGLRFTTEEILLAGILDQLRIANWSRTKDAKKKRNFPKSILEAMIEPEEKKEKKDEVQAFDSPEAFRKRLAEIRGENHGN